MEDLRSENEDVRWESWSGGRLLHGDLGDICHEG